MLTVRRREQRQRVKNLKRKKVVNICGLSGRFNLSLMAGPGLFLLLSLGILGFSHADTLSILDSSFCQGELKVIYPELDIDRCLTIPENLREKISVVWQEPQIYFSGANVDKKYILMMLDPDAPSRARPTSACWRHWLVVDIKGSDLKVGRLAGTTLTDYSPPMPPRQTDFHRYQFLLFEQPPHSTVSLSEEEASRGNWDPQFFSTRFNLENPVATLQFLTQNYND
ncbi:phosphatidylethanolamine-binding protein 4 [Solea solea]|uniref:phosphatidylethanolamine-binding protein 4 n=1 Tax=Solea solea TaxID=90069 RepID=UPI00272AF336|nr:phosphatidylethanolamine-binding protein 4 [Solea solea]